jgi:hypothetical protein
MPPTYVLHAYLEVATREQYQSTLPALEGVLRERGVGCECVLAARAEWLRKKLVLLPAYLHSGVEFKGQRSVKP